MFLVTVHDPICTESGNIEAALYGSFLPVPPISLFPLIDVSEYAAEKMPGAIIVKKNSPIVINKGRVRTRLRVTNNGGRPVQVSNVPNPQNQFCSVLNFAFRLGLTIILSKQTLSFPSTVVEPMEKDSTSQQVLQYDSNLETSK